MKRDTATWKIDDLRNRFLDVDFPEYQREPNIWSRAAKQRLIDSILREFDIASLYFYKNEDDTFDCIDGRQRIGAIMSFLGENPSDTEDDGFRLNLTNEIHEEDSHPFRPLNGKSFAELRASDDDLAKRAVNTVLHYRLNLVLLSEAGEPEEFNLQFTRLNLGTAVNAGEKLKAMVGEMRDLCFDDKRVGRHPFLRRLGIPTRRYAMEQVAVQVVAQAIEWRTTGRFSRARHIDLQRFLKQFARIPAQARDWIQEIEQTFDSLDASLGERGALLRSRALAVTVVLLAWERSLYRDAARLEKYLEFVEDFLCRLRWQIREYVALRPNPAYQYLLTFQRHLTQASVEKPAIEARFETMRAEFENWLATGKFSGDREYRAETGLEPSEECRR